MTLAESVEGVAVDRTKAGGRRAGEKKTASVKDRQRER